MKRFIGALALFLMVGFAATGNAGDLTASFGAGTLLDTLPPEYCLLQATHGGATAPGKVFITANGIDSAVISLSCLGVAVTTAQTLIVTDSAYPNGFSGLVNFPQTYTSTSPGVWTFKVGQLAPLVVVAQ